MDGLAGAGGDVAPTDDIRTGDFTVSQDTEFEEVEEVESDDDRPLDDDLVDDPPGIDSERRVDLGEERDGAAEDDA
ncbi:hypothetical protein ACDF64_11850 [Agromyces sp. MMS24-JH15]|uniref:hypothetical protein n=1 Tax=Agromyces sp. MMS24-JH15 TaxID=3243765 RepID=UPI003748874C